MFSRESFFPLTEYCILIFPFNSDELICKKEPVLLPAAVGPQTDIKLTAGWQRESLSPPSEFCFIVWFFPPPGTGCGKLPQLFGRLQLTDGPSYVT